MIDTEALAVLEAEWKSVKLPAELPTRLPLAHIKVRPEFFQGRFECNPRTGVANPHHVGALQDILRRGAENDVEPITVLMLGRHSIVIDGHHRLAAYKNAGRPTIPVKFFLGTPTEAVLAADDENNRERLPTSSMERRERAWALVCTGLFSKKQIVNKGIASDGTVAKMRKVLAAARGAGESPPAVWSEALRTARENNPDWVDGQVRDWATRIGKTFGPASKFSSGKVDILAQALELWSEDWTEQLAERLADRFGYDDEEEETVDAEAEVDNAGA